MSNKTWVKDFTIDFGFVFSPRTKKYENIVITSNGVFLNGEILVKGKLKANREHTEIKSYVF